MNTPASPWRVALLYNLKHPATLDPDTPCDALADADSTETVEAVELALKNAGHQVISLEADHTLLDSIRHVNPDICFNMARGIGGHFRSSQIPALLDMLNIPYTGSGILPLAITQDKAEMKRIWHEHQLPTAPSHVIQSVEDLSTIVLDFPLFVKPVRGKLGMGVDHNSVVHTHDELRKQVEQIRYLYDQPALVEQYLPGREFVVGVIGLSSKEDARISRKKHTTYGYRVLPILEVDSRQSIGQGTLSAASRLLPIQAEDAPTYSCPASILGSLQAELESLAIAASIAVNAAELSRIDFRLDQDGTPNILSISVLPSLEPQQSSLAQMVAAEGQHYDDFIAEILDLALERHCLKFARDRATYPVDSSSESLCAVSQLFASAGFSPAEM